VNQSFFQDPKTGSSGKWFEGIILKIHEKTRNDGCFCLQVIPAKAGIQ